MNPLKPQPAVYVSPTKPYDGTDHSELLGENIDSFNAKIMQHHVKPVTHIYIDLLMLKDIYLGALLRLCTSDEYTYILGNLDTYNNRLLENPILSYFPEVTSVTEIDILAYILDSRNSTSLVIGSPYTLLYASLPEMLKFGMKHNSMSKPESTSAELTICINTYPLPKSDSVKDILLSLFKSLHHDFKLQYISAPISEIDTASLLTGAKPKYDPMFIYDFISFIADSSYSHDAFVKQLRYFDTQIFTPRRIDPTLYDRLVETNVKLDDVLTSTEAALAMSCKFKYIPVSIPYSNKDG